MPCSRAWRARLTVWLLAGLVATSTAAAQETERRDPFEFGPRTGVGGSRGPVLIGVLWDVSSPLAIVGDHTVGLGDRVGPWTIAEIQTDRIVVEYAGRQETVRTGKRLPAP